MLQDANIMEFAELYGVSINGVDVDIRSEDITETRGQVFFIK